MDTKLTSVCSKCGSSQLWIPFSVKDMMKRINNERDSAIKSEFTDSVVKNRQRKIRKRAG